eukprot:9007244-Pyramimonas_sp.AAC.1
MVTEWNALLMKAGFSCDLSACSWATTADAISPAMTLPSLWPSLLTGNQRDKQLIEIRQLTRDQGFKILGSM